MHVSTKGYKIGRDVHVIESQDGNKLQLVVKAPHGHFGWFSGGHAIKVQIQVPGESDLDIHSGDGNVTSTAVSGAIKIDTGDGHITAQGLRGDIIYIRAMGTSKARILTASLMWIRAMGTSPSAADLTVCT